MSGFGRTVAWFGVNHYPDVRPDIMAMAKGLTSGYEPMGAAMVTDAIAAHFELSVYPEILLSAETERQIWGWGRQSRPHPQIWHPFPRDTIFYG